MEQNELKNLTSSLAKMAAASIRMYNVLQVILQRDRCTLCEEKQSLAAIVRIT